MLCQFYVILAHSIKRKHFCCIQGSSSYWSPRGSRELSSAAESWQQLKLAQQTEQEEPQPRPPPGSRLAACFSWRLSEEKRATSKLTGAISTSSEHVVTSFLLSAKLPQRGPSSQHEGAERGGGTGTRAQARKEEKWPAAPPAAVWPMMRGRPRLRENVPLTSKPFCSRTSFLHLSTYPSPQINQMLANLWRSYSVCTYLCLSLNLHMTKSTSDGVITPR